MSDCTCAATYLLRTGDFEIRRLTLRNMESAAGESIIISLCPLHEAAPDLLAALERIRKRAETDPTNLPVKMFAEEIVAMCTDAIYKAKLPT